MLDFQLLIERLTRNDPTLTHLSLGKWGQHLTLVQCEQMGNALAKAHHLQALDLRFSNLGDERIGKLFSQPISLESLIAQRCDIGTKGAVIIAQHVSAKKINLRGNEIMKEGLQAIIALSQNPTMTELNLAGCSIGDAGIRQLMTHASLTSLIVSCCSITDEGAKSLLTSKTLTKLEIASNKISYPMRAALKNMIKINQCMPLTRFLIALGKDRNNPEQSNSPLAHLPYEILSRILSFLDFSSLNRDAKQGLAYAENIFTHLHEIENDKLHWNETPTFFSRLYQDMITSSFNSNSLLLTTAQEDGSPLKKHKSSPV